MIYKTSINEFLGNPVGVNTDAAFKQHMKSLPSIYPIEPVHALIETTSALTLGDLLEREKLREFMSEQGNEILDLFVQNKAEVVRWMDHHSIDFNKLNTSERRIVVQQLTDYLNRVNPLKKKLVEAKEAIVRTEREYLTWWAKNELVLEKPQGSSLHHFMEFVNSPSVYKDVAHDNPTKIFSKDVKENFVFKNQPQIIVVEHNWYKAFENVPDFNKGTYEFPFEHCSFEFRISGVRVIAIVDAKLRRMHMMYGLKFDTDFAWIMDADDYTLTENSWTCDYLGNGKIRPRATINTAYVVDLVVKQMRAVCIMVDAKLAEGVEVIPSSGLNKQRLKQGKQAIRSHHIVKLLKKKRRYERNENPTSTGRKIAFHFRIGSWRHFERLLDKVSPEVRTEEYADESGFWKTRQWINWTTVGDPDYGIIEKHYQV